MFDSITNLFGSAGLIALIYFIWTKIQPYLQSISKKKEEERDAKVIPKIVERYSGPDIADPVNDLVKRLRNK